MADFQLSNLPLTHRLATIDYGEFKALVTETILLLARKQDIEEENKEYHAHRFYFPVDLQLYHLQDIEEGIDQSNISGEQDYTRYLPEAINFKTHLDKIIDPHFCARIFAFNTLFGWKANENDPNCRVIFFIHGTHELEIRKCGVVTYSQPMHAGEVWFCNTAHTHLIKVTANGPGVSIVLGCHYKTIKELMS